jgi:hypothetical protein
MILSPATRIWYIQEYENELYEMIMARGQEEAYELVKETLKRALVNGKALILEEGYEKGLKDGIE